MGRVWTLEEQKRVFEICEKYDVLVLSDEIHQDFTYNNHKQISALALEDGNIIIILLLLTQVQKHLILHH